MNVCWDSAFLLLNFGAQWWLMELGVGGACLLLPVFSRGLLLRVRGGVSYGALDC